MSRWSVYSGYVHPHVAAQKPPLASEGGAVDDYTGSRGLMRETLTVMWRKIKWMTLVMTHPHIQFIGVRGTLFRTYFFQVCHFQQETDIYHALNMIWRWQLKTHDHRRLFTSNRIAVEAQSRRQPAYYNNHLHVRSQLPPGAQVSIDSASPPIYQILPRN